MRKKSLNSDIIFRSLLCSIGSAITLSILSSLLFIDFSFLGILFYFLIFFFIYLIIASPIQFKLNQKPKRFNIIYLIIYGVGSALVTITIANLYEYEDPFLSLTIYVIIISSSIIFWIFDSVLLQDENLW